MTTQETVCDRALRRHFPGWDITVTSTQPPGDPPDASASFKGSSRELAVRIDPTGDATYAEFVARWCLERWDERTATPSDPPRDGGNASGASPHDVAGASPGESPTHPIP